MNTSDPLLHLDQYQCDQRKDQWQMVGPYVQAYGFMTRNQGEVLATLNGRDWGTPETPGPAMWALRGLINSIWKQYGRADAVVDLLQDPTPLPEWTADLWFHPFARQRFLRDLAAAASTRPDTAEARLFDLFLDRFPRVFAWAACNPQHLIGPKRAGWVDPVKPFQSPEEAAAKVPNPNYEGEQAVFFSFMADLVKSKYGVSVAVLEKILALDPMAGEHAETREKSLMEVAVHYRSAPLQAYASQRLIMEHTLHSQGVDRRDRNLPTLLIGKRRWAELRTMGLEDPLYLDATGHTYLHRLIESWLPVRYAQNAQRWVPRDAEDIEADIPVILEGWNTLCDLGCDPSMVCTPEGPLRLSKSGNRKGWPVKWRPNAALPGETPLQSLSRRAGDTNRDTFPPGMVEQFIATIRVNRAQRLGPMSKSDAPGRTRPRQRC